MSRLAAGRYTDRHCAQPKTGEINGRFTTADDAAPTSVEGLGFTVARIGTGQYRVTLDKAVAEILEVRASLLEATSLTHRVVPLSTGLDVGDVRTSASFVLETQLLEVDTDALVATPTDLDGPIVTFGVVYHQVGA